MMYVKMMSGENLSDTDPYKRFELLNIGDKDRLAIKLQEYVDGSSSHAILVIFYENGETENFCMDGNVYIMNQNGKTIAHYAPVSNICPSLPSNEPETRLPIN